MDNAGTTAAATMDLVMEADITDRAMAEDTMGPATSFEAGTMVVDIMEAGITGAGDITRE